MKDLVMFAVAVLMLSACPKTPPEAPAKDAATATQRAADAGKAFAPTVDAGNAKTPQKAAEAPKPDAGK